MLQFTGPHREQWHYNSRVLKTNLHCYHFDPPCTENLIGKLGIRPYVVKHASSNQEHDKKTVLAILTTFHFSLWKCGPMDPPKGKKRVS